LPLEINLNFHIPTIDALIPPRADALASSDFGNKLEFSLVFANSQGPCKFRSPQPAKALATNIVTKIPAPTVMVTARWIVFIEFLFLPRIKPAYSLKGAKWDGKLASPKNNFSSRAH
jgi:hypothetical protein